MPPVTQCLDKPDQIATAHGHRFPLPGPQETLRLGLIMDLVANGAELFSGSPLESALTPFLLIYTDALSTFHRYRQVVRG